MHANDAMLVCETFMHHLLSSYKGYKFIETVIIDYCGSISGLELPTIQDFLWSFVVLSLSFRTIFILYAKWLIYIFY